MDNNKQVITVESIVNAPVAHVWDVWTSPAHIMQWNTASPDWHTTHAENDLRAGGRFTSRMEAKDGSFGFDFSGIYTEVRPDEFLAYTLDDDRKVTITFTTEGDTTRVVEAFEAESENSIELQKGGWQAIMDNFKKHAETN